MPIRLEVDVDQPVLSTHEGLALRCALSNEGPVPALIPTPYDRSGSFRVGLYDSQLNLLRSMDRISRQRMMTDSRVSQSLDVDTLNPGARWNWKLNLSSFHYLIPPGNFVLDAAYEYEPAGVHVHSGPSSIRVTPDPIESVAVMRDNAVIDSLALLIAAKSETGPAWFLRQYNHNRPVAAWYSTRILADIATPTQPFLASAAYFQTAEVDPAFRKCVVWTEGQTVHARFHQNGQPDPLTRSTILPDGANLVRFAFVRPGDDLHLFFWNAVGHLEAGRLSPSGWQPLFVHQPRCRPGAPVAIGASTKGIHIVSSWRGLYYELLSWTGKPLDEIHVFPTRLPLYSLAFEPSEGRCKAIFFEGAHGQMTQLVCVDFLNDSVRLYAVDRSPFRAPVHELAFDCDRRGRFHLLTATKDHRLYYSSENRGPLLVAEGEENFYPIVVAPLKVFLGCYRSEYGFRFLQYRRRNQGPKLSGTELHP